MSIAGEYPYVNVEVLAPVAGGAEQRKRALSSKRARIK